MLNQDSRVTPKNLKALILPHILMREGKLREAGLNGPACEGDCWTIDDGVAVKGPKGHAIVHLAEVERVGVDEAVRAALDKVFC